MTQQPGDPHRVPTAEDCFAHAGEALLDAERTINNAGAAAYANDIVHATVAIAKGWAYLGGQIAHAPQVLVAYDPAHKLIGVEPLGTRHEFAVPPSQDPDNAWPQAQHGIVAPEGTGVFRAPVEAPQILRHDWQLGETPQRCRQCRKTHDEVVGVVGGGECRPGV